MSFDPKIEGMEEVKRRFDKAKSQTIIKRITRKSARQGMNLVRDAARSNAKAIDDPETQEKIWKNIATQGGRSRNPNEIVMRVGVRGGASFSNRNVPKLSGGDTRHWRFLEFPTANHTPVPFMRPALANNIQQVTNKFSEVFNTEIKKELMKP